MVGIDEIKNMKIMICCGAIIFTDSDEFIQFLENCDYENEKCKGCFK